MYGELTVGRSGVIGQKIGLSSRERKENSSGHQDCFHGCSRKAYTAQSLGVHRTDDGTESLTVQRAAALRV